MRIAFCGLGGTGKTTIAKELEKSLLIQMVPSVSRAVMKSMDISSESMFKEMPVSEAWEFQKQVHHLYGKGVLDNQYGIWDRSPFDVLAYSLVRCHTVMRAEDVNWVVDWATQMALKFDHIFWCMYDADQEKNLADGTRDVTPGTRHITQMVMHEYYNAIFYSRRQNSSRYILRWQPLDVRLEQCLAAIQRDSYSKLDQVLNDNH